jgi:hypothetical protein
MSPDNAGSGASEISVRFVTHIRSREKQIVDLLRSQNRPGEESAEMH